MSLEANWRSIKQFRWLLTAGLVAVSAFGCAPKPAPLPNLWLSATREDPFAKGQPQQSIDRFIKLSPAGWANEMGRIDAATIAPNGKWLLYDNGDSNFYLTSFDGKRTLKSIGVVGPGNSAAQILSTCWFSNSKKLMAIEQCESSKGMGIYGVEYDVRSSQNPPMVDLGQPEGSVKGWDGAQCWILGQIAPTQFLATTGTNRQLSDSNPSRVIFFLFDIHRKPAITRYYSVYLSKGFDMVDVAFDPPQRKLAWLLYSLPSDLEYQKPIHSLALAISDMEGRHMKTIGSLDPLHPPPDDKGNVYPIDQIRIPRDLKWLPDGRHVQFVFQNAVWTVHVS